MRLLAVLVFPCCLSAAQAASLFAGDAVLEADLAGPIDAVIEDGDARTEFPFEITVDGVRTPVDVRTRGKSRLRACRFPPLRLDFPDNVTAGSVFEGQNKLKLVTHCSTKHRDAGNVFDEYLSYRLFNLVSGDGYRVRLFRIRYTDTSHPEAEPQWHDAFLIESADAFATERGIETLEVPGVYLSKLDEQQAARVYIFQYLIGNTDWSLVLADTEESCCHNMDLFERGGRTLVVPYDFDLAGLVNASYARPDPELKIRNVRSRRYRGYCLPAEALGAALDEIVALEASMLELAAAVPSAAGSLMRDRLDYLAAFFEEAADRNDLLRKFEKSCL